MSTTPLLGPSALGRTPPGGHDGCGALARCQHLLLLFVVVVVVVVVVVGGGGGVVVVVVVICI